MNLFANDQLIIPFLATVGASLAVIFIQFFFRVLKETKQKIYAVSYISTISVRMLDSEFILKRHTIRPHVIAINRILNGDKALLIKIFESGEFDILRAGSMDYTHVPSEYLLHIGYDDITLVQMYETLLFLNQNEENRISMIQFVEENLQSQHDFFSLSEAKQIDILETYKEYLYRLEHEVDRMISFIRDAIAPAYKSYIGSHYFWFFKTKIPKNAIKGISSIIESNKDMLPSDGYMKESIQGGIQKEI